MVTQSPKEPKMKDKPTKRVQRSYPLLLKLSSKALADRFYALETPRDIANLLSVSYRRLVYHIYVTPKLSRYKTFEIPKRSGGTRQISTPVTALKIIQWKLNQVLQAVYQPKPSAHGFVPGKNIVTNAQAHTNKRYVLNLDLKNFFPSINFGRVRGMFMGIPYNLNPDVATVLAQICCHNDQLPQGAPTSPIITNMLCAKMDSQFQRLAKACSATYTRYADDITFSTTRPHFPESLARVVREEEVERIILSDLLLEIIEHNGFEVNEQKVRLQTRKHHQEVTGLTVNQFPNVDRRFVRQVRAMLHAWAKYGLEAAAREHREKHRSEGRFPGKDEPTFQQVLRGKIEFIGMVKGKNDKIYKKLLDKYFILSRIDKD